MVSLKLPFIQLYTVAGKQYAYFRRGSQRVRLSGELGSKEFFEAYESAKQSFVAQKQGVPSDAPLPANSLGALIVAWRGSVEYKNLKLKTRNGYEWGLSGVPAPALRLPVAKMNRPWIIRTRDSLSETPGKANYFVTVIKAVLFWGMDRGWIASNPAMKIKRLKGGGGYRRWTDNEIAAFTSERAGAFVVPVLLGLYTGQRRGDVLSMSWNAYDGQCITTVQGKTGAEVIVPVHPVLKAALDAAKASRSSVKICVRPDGKPWGESHFGHAFADMRSALGLPDDVHYHGLRHSAASRMAEAGASDSQIQAVTGHKTRQMVELYTAGARRKQLAKDAIEKLPVGRITNKSV